jgi:glycosyltransferase involved in cell wall biosynthesis
VLEACGETWSAGLAPPADATRFLALHQRSRAPLRRALSLARLLLRRHAAFAGDRYQLAAPGAWDLIVANDADMLPLAFRLATPRTQILFDAHEYAPREFEDRLYWRLFHQAHKTWLCATFAPRVHGFTTVCDGIADEYARVFAVPRPFVIPNAPPRQPGAPRPTPPDRIRLVHHGLASRSRKIELMIDLLRHLDRRFTLDLMLVASEPGYLEELRRRAGDDPRIRFRAPVPTSEIVAATRDYDVGLFLLPPTNLNYRFALPNKFFEFLQARLAVAIGPSPEMARLVHAHGVGIVADDFDPRSLAWQLESLDAPAIDRLKQAAHVAADHLCWENLQVTLRTLVEKLLSESCAA